MNFFRKFFKFCYNLKSCERQEKLIEANVEMAKDSSEMEDANINTDSGSSQDHLVTSSGDSLSNEDSNGVETMKHKQNLSGINDESMAETTEVDAVKICVKFNE